ncbi:hypothetical protein RHSIM_RhsimUnG0128500 [Rhododendron simsii]|uniref:Uncharacterized protein n=1 Tax=Rhododendron simsii TaxID=118357 RepID=A0A834FVU9_RHOSS|nr:hypothetical protein RHSIM_RhsimUnG0128500 [Rhododendron simsii]
MRNRSGPVGWYSSRRAMEGAKLGRREGIMEKSMKLLGVGVREVCTASVWRRVNWDFVMVSDSIKEQWSISKVSCGLSLGWDWERCRREATYGTLKGNVVIKEIMDNTALVLIPHGDRDDTLIWILSATGSYSTKSAREALHSKALYSWEALYQE